jgi:hypothetical protein
MNINDLPTSYQDDIDETKAINQNKYNLLLTNQLDDIVYISFNSQLLTLYKGNTLAVVDNLSNKYIAIVKNVAVNSCSAKIIYNHSNPTPIIIKVFYHKWWENGIPPAQILEYIFI